MAMIFVMTRLVHSRDNREIRILGLDDNRAFEIRFEKKSDYIYVFVTGREDSVEVSLCYWKEIVEECIGLGIKAVLIEEDFPNQISATDIYGAMTEIAKMVPTGLRVAFVDRRTEQHDLNLFAETVAVNRGAVGRVFGSVESAREWLRSTSDSA